MLIIYKWVILKKSFIIFEYILEKEDIIIYFFWCKIFVLKYSDGIEILKCYKGKLFDIGEENGGCFCCRIFL